LLHRWLNEPEVVRWYSDEQAPTAAAVRRKYLPRIDGESPTRVFIVELDGNAAGIAQTYRLRDYPEFAERVGAAGDWAGLDYLIGEPALRGRGLAHRIVDAFVCGPITGMAGIRCCAALPASDNLKSIRTLTRAGFELERELALVPGCVDLLMLRALPSRFNAAARGGRRRRR
jgi:aminoglycoside 6'-N-acetyltransferase